MRPALLGPFALALVILAAGATAQEASDPTLPIAEEALEVLAFRPRVRDPRELLDVARRLYGRRFVVQGPGRSPEAIDNLQLLDDTLLVYETKDRAATLRQALESLDSSGLAGSPPVETATYVPRFASTRVLLAALEPFARDVRIPRGDGSVGTAPGVSALEGLLLLRGTAESLQAMRQVLATVDVEPDPGDDFIRTTVYLPRHVGVASLMHALAPFQRSISTVHPDGSIQQFQNIAVPEGTGRLVLRDHPGALAHLLEVIAAFDVARPEVLVSCYVVQRVAGAPSAAGLPISPALREALDAIDPRGAFQVLGEGGVGLTAGSEEPVDIEMDLAKSGTCELRLEPGPFDPQARVLTFQRCEFMHRQVEVQGFTTRTSVPVGGCIPLGAVGDDPLYVFVQVRTRE